MNDTDSPITIIRHGIYWDGGGHHVCRVPRRWMRRKLGLEWGAVIECNECGQQWQWQYSGWFRVNSGRKQPAPPKAQRTRPKPPPRVKGGHRD